MSTTESLPIAKTAIHNHRPRVVSIDIFRGIIITVMIFVNALAEVRGLPWWTYHAHAQEDRMTYVDMVFPFFLFIVGMSMPLSVALRLRQSSSQLSLWRHVLQRVFALVVLGLILANAEKADASRMGMSGSAWALFGLISACLYLVFYPQSRRFPRYPLALRSIGLAGVVADFAIFRSTAPGGHSGWIDFSYPEILGLIGITYLAVAVLYIPTRRWSWAPFAWLVVLTSLNCLSSANLWLFPSKLPLYIWPFGNGAMASITMAGIITNDIFLGGEPRRRPAHRMSIALSFGALMLIAGRILTPLGISKIRATPSWSLYSIGSSVLVFLLLYWICDIRKYTSWALPFCQAGSNGLLTYLLPDLWYFVTVVVGFTFLDTHWSYGWEAVVKTLSFTVFILLLTSALTRAGVRLQL